MKVWDSIKSAFGPSQALAAEDHWLVKIVGGKTKAGVHVSHYNAITMPAVWACITLRADTHSSLPVHVFQTDGRNREIVRQHDLSDILAGNANPRMNTGTLFNTVEGHCLGWGNGYMEIQRTKSGGIAGLWPLLPDTTQPDQTFRNERGDLIYRVTIEGEQFELPSESVLHIKGYSWDGVVGISPVQQHRNAIGLGLAMEEFGSKFFSNDAKSGGFLQHPGKLSPTAKENIKDSVTKAGEGLDDAHRIKVLEEGMKYVPQTISPEDSQFLGSREFQIAEIARMYRVPLVLINSHQKDTAWGTGIEQLMIGFVQWTIRPAVQNWEQELNRKLLTPTEREQGLYIKFNLNAILRGDMAARAAFYASGIQNQWMVPNEAREKEDMNPLDGGDEPVEKMNASEVPTGTSGEL